MPRKQKWAVGILMMVALVLVGLEIMKHRHCRTVSLTDDNGEHFKLRVCSGIVAPVE